MSGTWTAVDPKNITLKLSGGTSKVYDGDPVTLTAEVKVSGNTVSHNGEYAWFKGSNPNQIPGAADNTYTVKNVSDSGTYTCMVVITGNLLATSNSQTVIITQRDLSGAAVTLSKDSFTYDGEEKSVSVVSVTVEGRTLTADTDYTVSGTTAETEPGTYEVTVSGKDNYIGSASASWMIFNPFFTVTLDPDGGSGGTTSITATYDAAMPDVTPPARDGYTFGGFYSEKNGGGTKYYNADGSSAKDWDRTGEATLYALWGAAGQCGINVNWEISRNTMTFTPSGSGAQWKDDCRQAIDGHADQVTVVKIPADGNDKIKVTGSGGYEMFKNLSRVTAMDLSGLDTGNVTQMNSMFYGCSGLNTLDLSGWNTGKVENMGSMFYNLSTLQTLTLGRDVRFTGYPFTGSTPGFWMRSGDTGTLYSTNALMALADCSGKWTAVNNNDITVTLSGGKTKVYDGTPVILTAAVTISGSEVSYNGAYNWYKGSSLAVYDTTDNTYAAVNVSDSGTYTCQLLTSVSSRPASNEQTVTITPKDLSGAEVTLSKDSFTYDGEEKSVSVVSVTVNGRTLTAGDDYTVSGTTAAAETGTYEVIVSGAGDNCTGSTSASWKIVNPSFTITLDPDGGSGGTASVNATYDAAMPAATMPARDGYTFGGFYSEKNGGGTQYYTAAGDSAGNWDKKSAATLFAQWTANTYTVTLDPDGGSDGTTSVTATYDAAMPAITSLPTRYRYFFGGYFSEKDGGGTKYYNADGTSAYNWNIPNNDTTLYAKWITVTVNSSLPGAGDLSANSKDGNITVNARANSGFAFLYWTDDSDSGGTKITDNPYSFPLTGDRSLTGHFFYARTLFTDYPVDRLPADRVNESITRTSETTTINLTPPDNWTLDNYTFGGWKVFQNESSETVVQSYTKADLIAYGYDKNVSTIYGYFLKASWDAKIFTVTLDQTGATAEGTKSVQAFYGKTMRSVEPPARDGYTFGGYFTEKDGGGKQYYNADGTSADTWTEINVTTLYPKWTAIPVHTVSVTVSPEGAGRVTGDGSHEEGSKVQVTAIANPGYVFEKWTGNGTEVTTAEYSFKMPKDDVSLTASFTEHVHDYGYSAEGNEITVTCQNSDGAHDGSLELGTVTITAPNKTYDGTAVTATVEKSKNFPDDIEFFDVEYENEDGYSLSGAPKDAGKYYAVLTVKKNGYSARQQFVIALCPVTDDMVTLDPASFLFDGGEKSPTVIVKHGSSDLQVNNDYSVSGDTTASAVSPETGYKITVTGKGNYTSSVTKTWWITINTAQITTPPAASAITFGQKLSDSTLSGGEAQENGVSVPGTFTWKEPDTMPAVSDSGITAFTVVFTPDDLTGYTGAETTVTLIVNKGSTDSGDIKDAPAANTLTADGTPLELVTAGSTVDGRAILYALGSDAQTPPADGYSASVPTGTEAGTYYVYYKIAADDNHAESDVFGPVIVEIADQPMDVTVEFVFLNYDGSRGVPFDIKEVTLSLGITLNEGEDAVSRASGISVTVTPKAAEASQTVTFSKKVDLAPGKYAVSVSGLPEKMEKEVPDAANAPKYKVTAKAEINTKDNDTVITVYLIWDNPNRLEPPVVYPLPEDEIGAYAIRKDGTKEYLLFHTYDICMAWLGNAELCEGPEKCFHKDGK